MLGQHLYSCRDTSNNKFMNQSPYYKFYIKPTKKIMNKATTFHIQKLTFVSVVVKFVYKVT